MKIFSFFIVLLSFLIQCQSVTPIENMNPDYGDIEGNIYESNKGKFVCYVPVDARYATMSDGNYKVSFQQKGIGLFKIQAIKLPEDFLQKVQVLGKEKTLSTFIETNLVNHLKKNRPSIRLTHSEYAKDFRSGTYFFLIHIPSSSEEIKDSELPYSSYAMMSFVSGNFIYLITRDTLPISASANAEELSEQINESRRRLIDFHSRIIFLGDATASTLDLDAFDPEGGEEEPEEEELGGGGGAGIGGEIDFAGILKVIQRRLYAPKGKFDIKPGRFKFNTKQFNSNKFKMSGRTHVSPGRFKMKSSFKSPRFKR